jgi:hydrogenase nickel incorporation protein HypA/HybF
MHELAIAESIVDLVEEHAKKDVFQRVHRIHVLVGELSHVDPRALEFGFEVIAKGTVAEGATLAFDRRSGSAELRVVDLEVF